jgi:hypothetical protein
MQVSHRPARKIGISTKAAFCSTQSFFDGPNASPREVAVLAGLGLI